MGKLALILMAALCTFSVTGTANELEDAIREGKQLVSEGHLREAVTAYETVLSKNPNHIGAYLSLGLLHANLGEIEKAIDFTRKASELAPSYLPFFNLGLIYSSTNQAEEAIKAFKEALKHGPNSYEASYQLGLVYTSLKDYANAKTTFGKSVQFNPMHTDSYLALGAVAFMLGDEKTARDQVQALKKFNKKTAAKALEEWLADKKQG